MVPSCISKKHIKMCKVFKKLNKQIVENKCLHIFTLFKCFNTQPIFYKTSPNSTLKVYNLEIFSLIAEDKKPCTVGITFVLPTTAIKVLK